MSNFKSMSGRIMVSVVFIPLLIAAYGLSWVGEKITLIADTLHLWVDDLYTWVDKKFPLEDQVKYDE